MMSGKLVGEIIIGLAVFSLTFCEKYEPEECSHLMCKNGAKCIVTPHNSTCNCTDDTPHNAYAYQTTTQRDKDPSNEEGTNATAGCNSTDIQQIFGNETCCSSLLFCWDVTECTNMTSCGNGTYCPLGEACDVRSPPCITNSTACFNDTVEYSCACTAGFADSECDKSIMEKYVTDVKEIGNMPDMLQLTGNLLRAVDDQHLKTYQELNMTVVTLADILKSISDRTSTVARKGDDLRALTMDFIKLTMKIIEWSQEMICDMDYSKETCSLTPDQVKDAIVTAEKSLKTMAKKMVTVISSTAPISDLTHGIIAIKFTRATGENLPPAIKTEYGQMLLPYWETLQGYYKKEIIAVSVLSYKSNPYIYIKDAGHLQTGIVLVEVINDAGKKLELPDKDDPVTVNADAGSSLSQESGWKDMIPVLSVEGAFLTNLAINGSVSAVTVDLKFNTRKTCYTYGKFGTVLPTEENFDMMIETKGKSRIKSYYPDDISPSFSEQVLQLAVNYDTKYSSEQPLLLVARCEDAFFRRRKRSLGSMPAHQVRITVISIQSFNPVSGWQPGSGVSVVAGPRKQIAFKSKIFGTFSADAVFIPPGEIDFSDVFLNFLEKLEDSPFALILILFILSVFGLISLILRRLDRQDQKYWNYLPLIDNTPWFTYTYLVSVSTSVRSSKKMSATPYMDLKGSRDKTGPRILSDGCRKNFCRGTSSHFILASESFLGELQTLKLWHDNKGKYAKWLPSRIVVVDISSQKSYVFTCDKWLSLDCDDGATWRLLNANDKEQMENIMFAELAKQALFDDNLWLSVSKRPHYSRFTRVQRLWTIASVLFLTMVTSAMFYNTPDTKGSSLKIGLFTLTYKQVYVGFLSVLITIIPNLFVLTLFRKRQFKNENRRIDGSKKTCCQKQLSFPWWSIFIGYILIAMCILVSSTFTFLYSLDWGRQVTLEWLFAYFIGALQSIFLMEPIKAIAIAAIFACCCGEKAMHFFQELPPQSPDLNSLAYKLPVDKLWIPESIKSPDEMNESEDFRKHRDKMQLERRFHDKVRSWSKQTLYLFLLGIICSHNIVTKSYEQNNHLKTSISPDEKITTAEEFWVWMYSKYVPTMFPKNFENGLIRPSYQQRFAKDGYHYRMGLTRIRQVRVKGLCRVPPAMTELLKKCPVTYSSKTESTEHFCKAWKPYNTTCFDENEEVDYGYLYQSAEDTEAVPFLGRHGLYSAGGYVVDIGPKQSLALQYVQQLRLQAFFDSSTRALFVDTILFNANSRLFSQVKTVLEQPAYGLLHMEILVSTANLYPYINAFDFFVLFIQVIFIAVTFVRIILLLVDIFRTRGGCIKTILFWVLVIEISLAVMAIVFYCLRIDHTTRAVEKIGRNPGRFVSFDMIHFMDMLYVVFLSGTMFFAILRLLGPLTFNYQLHILSTAINTTKVQLSVSFIVLQTLVVAFSTLLYLTYGSINLNFRDMVTSIFSLNRVAIGMLKFRQDMSMEDVEGIVIFVIFGVCVTFVMINFFISTLNLAFSDAQIIASKPGIYKFDKEMNAFFWEKLEGLFNFFSLRNEDTSKKYEVHKNEDVDTLMEQLTEHLVNQFCSVINSEKELLNACISKKPKKQNRNKLICTSKIQDSKTHFSFYDRLTHLRIILMYQDAIFSEEIDIRTMRTDAARPLQLYPCTKEAEPRSNIFMIRYQKLMTSTLIDYRGEVEIHIADDKATEKDQDAFLLTSFNDGADWTQIPAKRKSDKIDKNKYYICTTVDSCPTRVMAISYNPTFPPDLSTTFTVNNRGGRLVSQKDKGFRVDINRCAVVDKAEITVTLQPSFPAPQFHILSTSDIDRPIQVTIPHSGTENLIYDYPIDFITLVQDGCLPWKKENLNLIKTFKTFVYNLDGIQKGVKKTVLIKESEIQNTQKRGNKRTDDMNRLIYNISTNSAACRRWFQIGKKIGLSNDFLMCLDEGVPRCPEEKCSIVLQEWCQSNKGATAEILGTVLNDTGIVISKVAVKNLLEGKFL